jgi:predicted ATPase
MTSLSPNRVVIAITGGPGGGKTTLMDELYKNSQYKNKFVVLPEAVFYVLQTKTSPAEKLFQKIMVEVQSAMENAIDRCFEPGKIILCHRGTLDPLAYWLNNCWNESEFFKFTQTSFKEHFNRYNAVIHLQTSAKNAETDYRFYPDAHRHEDPKQAVQIDNLLANVWKKHPNYSFIKSEVHLEIKRKEFFSLIERIDSDK